MIQSIFRFKFIGPVAENALDYYNYKLVRTLRKDRADGLWNQNYSAITDRPAFSGIFSIADSSFAVMGIEVRPNEAFHFPFVNNIEINYNQTYSLYDEKFWMPTNIAMAFGGRISLPGISFPNIKLDQTSVIYDYKLNTVHSRYHTEDARSCCRISLASKYDSTFWDAHRILSFYIRWGKGICNSWQHANAGEQFKPSGAAATALSFSPLQYIDIRL